MDTTFATELTAERARADERLALVAYTGGVVGIVGIVTICLMFAVEVPRGGPYVFGSANDISGSVFSALFIPLVFRLGRTTRGAAGMKGPIAVTVAASIAGIILPLMLVAGTIAFERQLPMVLAVFVVQSLWLLAAGLGMRGVRGVPAGLTRLTIGVGGAIVVGGAIAGAGYLLPSGSLAQVALVGLGAVVGGAGWLGWPLWFLAVGRALRRGFPG